MDGNGIECDMMAVNFEFGVYYRTILKCLISDTSCVRNRICFMVCRKFLSVMPNSGAPKYQSCKSSFDNE